MSSNLVVFESPKNTSPWDRHIFIRPVNKSATYFCLLVGKKRISPKDLYIIQKIGIHMGFSVQLIEESTSLH